MSRKLLLFLSAFFLLVPVVAGAQYMSRIIRIQNFEECAEKFPVMENFPRQCRAGWKIFSESIPEEEPNEEGTIHVTSPQSGDTVSFPLRLAGEARTFEGTIRYRLRDTDGTILVDGFTTAAVEDPRAFSPFSEEIAYPQPGGRQGILEVFEESAMDGEMISLVTIPVYFPSPQE